MGNNKKRRSEVVAILFLLLLLGLVFWKWWLPGPKVANDFPYISGETLIGQVGMPQAWTNRGAVGLGEYTVFTMWSWPQNFILGILARLGFNFLVLERFLLFIPFLLVAVFGIWMFLSSYRLSKKARFVASLFFVANTYTLLLLDGGQLTIALAYAWFPIVFLTTKESLSDGFGRKVIAGLAVWVLGFLDIRFLFVFLMLISINFLYDLFFLEKRSSIAWLQSWIKSGLMVGLITALLNTYWLLPFYKFPLPSEIYSNLTKALSVSFTSLGHAFFLLQPHWYKNVFGKITQIRPEFALIPILVFLAPVLVSTKKSKKKARELGFWLLVALVGIFLVKGANPPLPGLYPWLFNHIPGFSFFRDPTKFFFLVALSYSVLIGVTVDGLSKRFNWKVTFGKWTIDVIPIFLIAYFLLLISPVYTGKMTGTFAEPVNKQEFSEVTDIIKNDSGFGRVFWIPTRAPLGYSSPNHPLVEAARLVNKRPFAIGTVGTYEIFNYLREASFMGELFKVAGIEYLVYPFPDTRREELKQDNIDYYYAFLDQLSNLPWIDGKLSQPPVPVLKTKESTDHFFVAQNSFCLVGSDRIYWELADTDTFNLSNNAMVFIEEKPALGTMVRDNPCTYLLFEKGMPDLTASFVNKEKFIFPAKELDFDPDSSGWLANRSLGGGWWKRETADLIRWRAFLEEKYGIDNLDFDYGGGWAVAEGDLRLTIDDLRFTNENMLLARVMVSNKGGRIEFFQGEEKIGEINTKVEKPSKVQIKLTGYKEIPDQVFEYDKADFAWFEVGRLTVNNQQLVIKTEGDINVINALISVSENEWVAAQERVDELIYRDRVLDWGELSESEKTALFAGKDEASLSYQRVSPTHYKVKVENVKEPVTLAFSETYDSLWELDGRSSYPLYSLINGFTIREDGEYDIIFSAQKYVLPGLFITATTLASISLFLVLRTKKDRKI